MPVAILLAGLVLIIVAFNGKESDIFAQVQSDMIGAKGFIVWVGLIVLRGIIGAALRMDKTFSMLQWLIIAVYVIGQKGLWANVSGAVENAQLGPKADVNATGTTQKPPEASPFQAGPQTGAGGAAQTQGGGATDATGRLTALGGGLFGGGQGNATTGGVPFNLGGLGGLFGGGKQ